MIGFYMYKQTFYSDSTDILVYFLPDKKHKTSLVIFQMHRTDVKYLKLLMFYSEYDFDNSRILCLLTSFHHICRCRGS